MSVVVDLLFPRTDAGALGQFIVATFVFAVATALVWRHREVRVLVFGLWLSTYAFFALRTLH